MSLVQLLSVGFALAVSAVPVLVLRRPVRRGLRDGEAEPSVPPAIVRNAWIAYAARLSLFVPLFALGAAGDVWMPLAGAVGFGLGICLLGAMGRPIAAFLAEARRAGRPATLPAFLAQACGGGAGVRVAVASVTVVALLGLMGAEAAALAVVLTPLAGSGAGVAWFATLVAVAVLYAVSARASDVRYVSQALLGAIHVGLFGAAAFLLYLSASDLRPLPPHGAFALVALAACCLALLAYRQTKSIETPHLLAPTDSSRWRRAVATPVRLLQRLANVVVSIVAVAVVVIAGMEVYVLGVPDILRDALAALGAGPPVSALGCAGIAMLALAAPLVDAVNWQSADALVDAARAGGADPDGLSGAFRRPLRVVAGEAVLIAILAAAFGALGALATDLTPDETALADFVRQLVVFDNEITDAILTLLLVAWFAMAAATMGMAASAARTIVGLDILPALRRMPDAAAPKPGREAGVATAVAAAAVAAAWIVSGAPAAGAVDARFFALVLVFACLQLSLVPLLLAGLAGVSLSGGRGLAVLGAGAAAGLGSVAIFGVTADGLWLWLAVPACLGAGVSLLALVAIAPSRT